MILVEDFYQKYKKSLGLEVTAGRKGLSRHILGPELQRAGIFLTGFTQGFTDNRVLLFGNVEGDYLQTLPEKLRAERLEAVVTKNTPVVIASEHYQNIEELIALCDRLEIPLLTISDLIIRALNKLSSSLLDEFVPVVTRHGTFIEIYDVGVLIEGDSAIGKSETALGLIEKGHRLVSDDVVRIKRKKEDYLEGHGVELTRYHMEIRGIGIINVANIYGAYCVRDKKKIDIIVKLETWNNDHFYDRLGLEENTCEILGIEVPHCVLPVKPGRDVVLLIETIALNQRLKKMGSHSAEEFRAKQRLQIAIGRSQRPGAI